MYRSSPVCASLRLLCALSILSMLLVCHNQALSQNYYPPMPPQVSFDNNVIGPFLCPSPKVIADTKFPWADRDGNITATFTVPFTLTMMYGSNFSWSDVSVFVDGHAMRVIPDPVFPDRGTAVYEGPPIGFGNSVKYVSLEFKYQGTTMTQSYPHYGPATATYPVYGYAVDAYDGSLTYPSFQQQDEVDETDNLFFLAGVLSGKSTYSGIGRHISDYFKIHTPDINQGFTGISVGFAQTMPSATLGTITYTGYLPNMSNAVGHDTFLSSAPFPQCDAISGTFFPYYDSNAYHTVSYMEVGPAAGNIVLDNYLSAPIQLVDTPNVNLIPYEYTYQGSTYVFTWGVASGNFILYQGSHGTLNFEDTLVACTGDCPGVYVPIKAYKSWSVHYAGKLNNAIGRWEGGSVSSSEAPSTANKPETERGSAIYRTGLSVP